MIRTSRVFTAGRRKLQGARRPLRLPFYSVRREPLVARKACVESSYPSHERNLICLPNQVSFNDIRSLSERVIYLRYDIALRAMIYACGRIKERILYHIATKSNISYRALARYIMRRSRISLTFSVFSDIIRTVILCQPFLLKQSFFRFFFFSFPHPPKSVAPCRFDSFFVIFSENQLTVLLFYGILDIIIP